jgi:flagellin
LSNSAQEAFGDNIMSLVINSNLGSINGQKNLNASATGLSTAMQRLSSGVRVNNAKDDAAGLAIADRMNSQIRGMTVAVRNANDGISLTQTAEGALGSLTDTLQRMRDLAVQSSSNAGVSATDRQKMNTEFSALQNELMRVTANTEFNGKKVLAGDLAGGLNIQVGATTDTNSRISVSVSNMANLLSPVTLSTLSPAGQPTDSTLASTITNLAAGTTAAADPQLTAANAAAKLANAAVVAAKAAAAAPADIALAKAASAANNLAAAAIGTSSANISQTATTNLQNGLASQAFVNATSAASSSNTAAAAAVATTDGNIINSTSTDAAQASSLLTTATQLATAAAADVTSAGQNAYATTMYTLTGDTLSTPATAVDPVTGKLFSLAPANTTATTNVLNDAINRATPGTFLGDREAQKALAATQIAQAIAGASYVNDPLATTTANETNKQSYINSSQLVVNASTNSDKVATDYALSAINSIDTAIASIDTERSNLGSTQNRFTTTISNLQNGIENQSAAKSRIMDADFAAETANLSKGQILQQAGTAMLAQANQSGQGVLTLLR